MAKQAVDRLASTNSTRLRLASLSLLTTALYVLNADFLSRASPDRFKNGADPSLDLSPAEVALNTSTEYLTILWQCLRGLGNSSNRQPPHISPMEARCIGLSLKSLLEDIGRCLLSTYDTSSTILGGLVNKAIAEVTRMDRVYVKLVYSVLRGVTRTFCGSERGTEMVREWVLLTLPSLLQRQKQRTERALRCHGYWVAAICIMLIEAEAASDRKMVDSLLVLPGICSIFPT